MPTYRSINIALHSQFDLETLPEYYPPPLPSLLATHNTHSSTVPPLIDDKTSTCSVNVPVLPGSQFWIAYLVSSPVPEDHYFLFKLYISGEKVVSWSTGKEDGWMGKTMYGLFESDNCGDGRSRIEKRVLCFSAARKEGEVKDGCMEIKVHRASGRKRVEREVQAFAEMALAKNEGGINLVNAGRAGPEQPKRFYKFALIDPVDQPFASFRFYYRTWDQLHDLGLLGPDYYAESEENSLSVIEPVDGSTDDNSNSKVTGPDKSEKGECGDVFHVDGDGISIHDWSDETTKSAGYSYNRTLETAEDIPHENDLPSRRDSIASGTYVPRGAPGSDTASEDPGSPHHGQRLNKYRLSMPPSIKFDAPESVSRPLPIPRKNDHVSSSTAYRPHPAYPAEEWPVLPPSPVRSPRKSDEPSLLEERTGLGITGAGLLGVFSSTWKRSISGGQAQRQQSEVREGPRSVSY